LRLRLWRLAEWLICKFRIRSLGGCVDSLNHTRVIFVCTGNICRSPFAEALARKAGLLALSCGTDTRPGLAANPDAIEQAASFGIDLGDHRTGCWDQQDLRRGDLVVALELHHLLRVRRRAGMAGARIVLMSALRSGRFEVISDPYGRGAAEFQRVYGLIHEAMQSLVQSRSKFDT
jgi:protein-tyrosine phosphatase